MDWKSLGTNQLSSITHPFVLGWVDLGAKNWLVTKLESGCVSARCENRTSLVFVRYSIDMPFTNIASSRYWTIYLTEKIYCSRNGAVIKNRTLSKCSCQVRRLSKLKPACLIHLYSFVCSVTRHVPQICRCLAVLCSYMYFLAFVFPAITQTHWHGIE